MGRFTFSLVPLPLTGVKNAVADAECMVARYSSTPFTGIGIVNAGCKFDELVSEIEVFVQDCHRVCFERNVVTDFFDFIDQVILTGFGAFDFEVTTDEL